MNCVGNNGAMKGYKILHKPNLDTLVTSTNQLHPGVILLRYSVAFKGGNGIMALDMPSPLIYILGVTDSHQGVASATLLGIYDRETNTLKPNKNSADNKYELYDGSLDPFRFGSQMLYTKAPASLRYNLVYACMPVMKPYFTFIGMEQTFIQTTAINQLLTRTLAMTGKKAGELVRNLFS